MTRGDAGEFKMGSRGQVDMTCRVHRLPVRTCQCVGSVDEMAKAWIGTVVKETVDSEVKV